MASMFNHPQFYGCCRICDCTFMGSVDNECSCKHSNSQHVALGVCKFENCDCENFESPENFAQCYNCLHDSGSHGEAPGNQEYNQLKLWIAQGLQQKVVIELYAKRFQKFIGVRTLQRLLAEYNLHVTNPNITDEQILQCVKLENGNGIHGYHRMHRILRVKHGLLISRNRLHALMRDEDHNIPKGIDPKIDRRRYHQKPFDSNGPNWLWAMDGHEKLAQPFGLYIYGIIDTYSRKVLSLKVLPNKRKDIIAQWLIGEINNINGVPKTMMADKGSEWNDVIPHLNAIQMKSTFNQKIEAFWSQLSTLSDIKSFKTVLWQLDRDGLFNAKDEKDRWALYMAFHRPVQQLLNNFREIHNTHIIRKQKNVNLPTGQSPDVMYQHSCEEVYLQVLESPLVSPETEDFTRKFEIPRDLYDSTRKATKEDCFDIYIELRQHLLNEDR